MSDFGMPTLIELSEIEDCARLCNELGLQFIELNMNLPQYQPEIIDIDKLLLLSKKYNIYYTIHLDENFNPCDFNNLVADAYKQTVQRTIEIANKLSVPIINMHLSDGVYFTMPDRKIYLFDENLDLYLKKQADFLSFCENAVGGSNIQICIENSNGYRNFHKEALNILLQSTIFSLTYDIGHNHGISENDENVILSNQNKLIHFHFHDAIGTKNHLALGTGEIDLHKYLKLASQLNSRIVIETKTIAALKQSVKWINHIKAEDYLK